MTRKDLVSVQRVVKVEPHPNADKLLMATVQGWESAIGRDEKIKEGDLIVFVQPGAIMPERPEFSFLKDFGWKVRVALIRGKRSAGLILPLNAPMVIEKMGARIYQMREGDDITDMLGIKEAEAKCEEAECLHPSYMTPTNDEINICPTNKGNTGEPNAILRAQGYVKIFQELKGVECYITVKANGETATYYLYPDGDKYAYSTKKNQLKLDQDNDWKYISEKYHIKDKLEKYLKDHGVHISVHGEICGPGILGNQLGLKDKDILVFGVYNIDKQEWFDYAEAFAIAKELGLPTVEVLEVCQFNYTMADLERMVLANKYEKTGVIIEGVVVRPTHESQFKFSQALQQRPSFKVLYEDITPENGGKVKHRKLKPEVAC